MTVPQVPVSGVGESKSVERRPMVLKGAERKEALLEMRRLFESGSVKESDGLIAALARRDPSLLRGPNGPHALTWHHTGLRAACFFDLAETLTVAFEAGMDPDDADLFGGQPVLSMRHRPFDFGLGPLRPPSLAVMKAALRHGANANRIYTWGPGESERAPTVQYHANQVHLANDLVSSAALLEKLDFVAELLRHGATGLDESTSHPLRASRGFLHLLCGSRFARTPGLDLGIAGTEAEGAAPRNRAAGGVPGGEA
ncbi:hypothetical protein [Methylibium petroleiphilum]|nr:hypothetical protein [Methylibium petroleiphilum]